MIPVDLTCDASTFSESATALAEVLRIQGRPDLIPWAFVAGGFAELANQMTNGSGECCGNFKAGGLHVEFRTPGRADVCLTHICSTGKKPD